MKKILALTLAFLLLFGMAACAGNQQSGGNTTAAPTDNTEETQPAGSDTETTAAPESTAPAAEGAKLTGKIELIELDDRDPSVLRGMVIKGNQAGTAEGFNNKASSLTDVRCIFQLNEWVEFYPDTDKEYALRVWVLKHRDDREYYNTAKFSDLDPNFANYCDLHYPVDEENPEEWQWGSFYLNDECEPGYYDFVFTYEGKAIGTLLTRFYADSELTVKSDAELEALMHE